MTSQRTQEIKAFLLEQVAAENKDIIRPTQERFGISRQAVNRHLRNLVAEGVLIAEGRTRQHSYRLAVLKSSSNRLVVSTDLHEDEVWRNNFRPLFEQVPDSVRRICQYGFTEMLNNAIDHSEGNSVTVEMQRTAATIVLSVNDNGVGIFHKLKRELQLEDERYVLLELTKGKLTTEPKSHTGQGIFFTSRIFDTFTIRSSALIFSHKGKRPGQDWLLEDHQTQVEGTQVTMQIALASDSQLAEIFERFTAEADEYGFSRTIVPVTLARFGDENLLSRSQAKRLLARFDRFHEVLLDFESVEFIGQAFADEVFRVFRSQHPEVNLSWINANPSVESMIIGARAAPTA